MKKIAGVNVFFVLIAVLIIYPQFAYSNGFNRVANIDGGIRPFAVAGKSFADDAVDDFQYGGGLQIFFGGINQILYAAVGVEAGYCRLYKSAIDEKEETASYFNCMFIAEATFYFVTLQIGAGRYFTLSEDQEDATGLLLAPGLNLPIDKGLAIPVLCRMNWLLADERVFSIGLFTGFTLFF